MSSDLLNWISIFGSLLSLIGVIIAIVQIRKTRRAAEAAKDASLQAQRTISRNLLLSDVPTCTRNLEQIKQFVRDEKYESSQLRIGDLILELIQIQEILKSSNQVYQFEFEEILSQLSIIRENFEKKLAKSSVKIDAVQVNSQLSKISDDLNKLIGEAKLAIKEGD